MFRLQDTIIAVSSPPGRSLRGLLRLTGPRTLDMVTSLILAPAPVTRQLTATVIHLHAASGGNRLSLPALLTCWQAPGSFTGQDSAEIQCPGHPALLDRLLQQVTGLGARLANPGEFTFRAFMHGKIDLTQAEGVAATIAATGHAELAAARHLCAGELGQWSRGLVDRLASLLALLEAGIDFTDQEDVLLITPAQALGRVHELRAEVESLRNNSRSWKQLEALPRVVLAGPPSVGKSTLFNRLLGQDRAVTHEAPGTTRDVLAEPLTLTSAHGPAVEVMLVDVAGLDSASNVALGTREQGRLDALAQQAARQAIADADLLLVLHSPCELNHLPGLATMQGSLLGSDDGQAVVAAKPTLHLLAQCDRWAGVVPETWLPISALRGDGLSELRQRLMQIVGQRGVSLAGDKLALQPRHEAAVVAASSALQQAEFLLEPQAEAPMLMEVELVAGYLRLALDELACLGGSLSPDEVLGRVFAKFCIGK